jgi:hypothetical protein
MLALGIKIIRNAETEIRNAEVEKVFGKPGLSPTVNIPVLRPYPPQYRSVKLTPPESFRDHSAF